MPGEVHGQRNLVGYKVLQQRPIEAERLNYSELRSHTSQGAVKKKEKRTQQSIQITRRFIELVACEQVLPVMGKRRH